MSVQRLGFSVLATGEKNGVGPVVNIVFVHGLRGHPKHTWEQNHSQQARQKDKVKGNSSRLFSWRSHKKSQSSVDTENDSGHVDTDTTYWPQDLLPQKVSNARILTYGYDAHVIGSLFQGASKNSITQHGRDMMLQLEREIHGEPIIFVAHSLGGILVKEGLQWSKSHISPRYQELYRCSKSLVFLGVPHRGSPTANVGEIMTHVANAALRDTNKHILRSLAVDGEILDRIHSEFMKMLHAEDFSVHSFQEGRGLSGVKGFSGKVVDDFSSKLDHPLEVVETIDANHMQMARYSGAEDPGYRKISSVIATFVVHLQQDQNGGKSTATVNQRNTGGTSTANVDVRDAPPAEKRYFRVPHISNHHFIGRVKELEWLRINLEDLAMEGEQQRLVIWGSGGAGKTQLVSTYVFRNQSKYSAVFWVTASSNLTIRKTYADIGKHLGLSTPSSGDQQATIDSVKDWFTDNKQGDWLLVIDNADRLDEVDIEAFIPPANKGSVIITSRDRQAAGFGPAIELGEMDAGDASALLLRRAAIQYPKPADEKTAAEIVRSLGYLALAIEHAGSYVQSVSGSLQDYQLHFQRNRKGALAKSAGISMHKESVSETFNISFNTIKDRNLPAAKLLCFLAFLDAEAILEDLVLSTHESITMFWTRVVSNQQEYLDAIQELLSFSLVRVRSEGNQRVVSLHPLVHYLGRVRLDTENHWRWKAKVAYWLLQSSLATAADTEYFPHVREQMQQLDELLDLPEDTQIRRAFHCCLALLQYQYRFAWHNQGAMDELYKYSQTVSAVLEEILEENDYLSVIAMDAVTNVQANTVQYVDCNMTYDQVVRRYLIKRMTPSAVLALESASTLCSDNSTIGNIAGKEAPRPDGYDVKTDILLDMTALTTVVAREINAEPVAVASTAEEAKSLVEAVKSIQEKTSNMDTTRSGKEPADFGAVDVSGGGSSDFRDSQDCQPGHNGQNTAERGVGSGKRLLNELTPRDTHLEALEKRDDSGGKSPTTVDLVTDTHSFRPKYLSEVFVSVTPPIYVQSLVQYLTGLIHIYYTHKRTTEANLLLAYSTLPLDPSLEFDAQPQQVSQLLIEAGRLVAEGDLDGMLNVLRKLLATAESSSLEAHYMASDYAIIMNKTGKPKEAELVIKQIFYHVPGQPEEVLAKDLKDAYVWAKKTLSVSQRLQGQLEESLWTLLVTLQTARQCFGPNSLSCLHAAMLLQILYSESTRLQSSAEADKHAEEFEKIFENLYSSGAKASKEGLQMGMILWSQGALEEAVQVFDAFARLNAGFLGEYDQLTQRARRASAIARKELDGSQTVPTQDNVLKYGTVLFPRKVEDLALLIESYTGEKVTIFSGWKEEQGRMVLNIFAYFR